VLANPFGVRILHGSSVTKEPFDMSVERFLSMLRFENKAILDGLGLEIEINTPKSID
jgi:hypothetical protein